MNQIISVCGSQGCGKSTTIEQLRRQHNYTTDSFSTPRYVQAALGYKTLAEVLAEPIQKIKDYQLKILDTKFERDLANKSMNEGGGAVIVERNFADIYSFALQWALDSKDQSFIDWVNTDYKKLCVEAHKEVDYFSILLTPLKSFEVDPRRASETSRFDVHERMMNFLFHDVQTRTGDQGIGNCMMLGFDSLQERISHIHNQIQLSFFRDGGEAKRIVNEGLQKFFYANRKSNGLE